MLQVIDEVLANPKDKTKLQLVFANQSEADILLKKEIDDRAAAHPSRLSVYYVVDKSSSWMWKGGTGYVTEAMLKEHMPAPSSDSMIFVSVFWSSVKSFSVLWSSVKSFSEFWSSLISFSEFCSHPVLLHGN